MSEDKKSKSVWGIVLKVIITVATAIAGALGLSACK
ncbi:smalltalk protein [Bacteroides uniformis]|nr:smalltalk protein [Bacteroides uniformis]KAB3919255.1 smalltalk protein [Bacteroides uniformis]KAB3922231.1 smalltalk protein [Bacteroides uniformis]KAB4018424.1 smalltalk protein [Bacteroides uniformis]KAB4030470.1 smalltalk protein [Bacteroides uniformis]